MNPLKNLNATARWLTVVFASVLFASVGIVTYNAFADGAGNNTESDNSQSNDNNMTNDDMQHWREYHHNYNMASFVGEKEGEHWENHDEVKSNSNSTSCGPSESIVNYVGNGNINSTLVPHKLGTFPRVIYIMDLTNPPSGHTDGVTTVISTKEISYVVSANNAYAPIPMPNTNIVNSTTVDVGQIFNQITQIDPFSLAVNHAGSSYELIALNFAGGNCSSSSSHSSGDNDEDNDSDQNDNSQGNEENENHNHQ